jgi:hypothetical protein
MKKKVKKLVLAKETLRGLDNLRQVAGGTLYEQQFGRTGGTVESGCTDCDPSVGSCCTCFATCGC